MAKILDAIIEVFPVSIAKLEMKPGDTLVVRMDMGAVDSGHMDMGDFVSQLQGLVPEGCNAVILPKDAELTIIPKEPTE